MFCVRVPFPEDVFVDVSLFCDRDTLDSLQLSNALAWKLICKRLNGSCLRRLRGAQAHCIDGYSAYVQRENRSDSWVLSDATLSDLEGEFSDRIRNSVILFFSVAGSLTSAFFDALKVRRFVNVMELHFATDRPDDTLCSPRNVSADDLHEFILGFLAVVKVKFFRCRLYPVHVTSHFIERTADAGTYEIELEETRLYAEGSAFQVSDDDLRHLFLHRRSKIRLVLENVAVPTTFCKRVLQDLLAQLPAAEHYVILRRVEPQSVDGFDLFLSRFHDRDSYVIQRNGMKAEVTVWKSSTGRNVTVSLQATFA